LSLEGRRTLIEGDNAYPDPRPGFSSSFFFNAALRKLAATVFLPERLPGASISRKELFVKPKRV
jgi:hypothetical protein